jgi:hypothetical protein
LSQAHRPDPVAEAVVKEADCLSEAFGSWLWPDIVLEGKAQEATVTEAVAFDQSDGIFAEGVRRLAVVGLDRRRSLIRHNV